MENLINVQTEAGKQQTDEGSAPDRAPRAQGLLFFIKLAHSIVFLVESAAIMYILGCGLFGRRGRWLKLAYGLVGAEVAVFVGNGRRCPLTKVAQALGDPTGDDLIADIFLPNWFIPLVTPVCGGLAAVGSLLVLLRVRRGGR